MCLDTADVYPVPFGNLVTAIVSESLHATLVCVHAKMYGVAHAQVGSRTHIITVSMR